MEETEGPKNTAGFQGTQQVDRSASGLQYQSFNMGLVARGSALGMGRRVAPNPSVLFSNPPVSGGQFGGGHAKSTASFTAGPEED
jgi:hypothetical protein